MIERLKVNGYLSLVDAEIRSCHAMLHRRTPPLSIEELRNALNSNAA
jgi:hypothetical protein